MKTVSLWLAVSIAFLFGQAEPCCANSDISVRASYLSPAGYTKLYTASSTGRPLLAGQSGVVTFVGAVPGEDSIVNLPTISAVSSVEYAGDGIIALTEDHQLFRSNPDRSYLVFSRTDTKTSHLAQQHWAFCTPDGLFVGSNANDTAQSFFDVGQRAISYFGSLSADRYVIGFEDGTILLKNNSGELLFNQRDTNGSILFVTIDPDGHLITSTSNGTRRVDSDGTIFSAFLPYQIRMRAKIGSDHFVVFDREYIIGDSAFATYSVFDVGGSRVYNGLCVRTTAQPLDSVLVVAQQLDFPRGKELHIRSSNSLTTCSATPGRYATATRDDITGVLVFVDPNPNTYNNIVRTFSSFRVTGRHVSAATITSRVGAVRNSTSVVVAASAERLVNRDTLNFVSYGIASGAVLSAVLETESSMLYFFSNVDTLFDPGLIRGTKV